MARVDTNRPTLIDACYAAKFRTAETGILHVAKYLPRKGWSAVSTIRPMVGADIGV